MELLSSSSLCAVHEIIVGGLVDNEEQRFAWQASKGSSAAVVSTTGPTHPHASLSTATC